MSDQPRTDSRVRDRRRPNILARFLPFLTRRQSGPPTGVPIYQSKICPDLPPFEYLADVPSDRPQLTWLPGHYRRTWIAKGTAIGFRVPDEIVVSYSDPKSGGGGPAWAIECFTTFSTDPLLTGTHVDGKPFDAKSVSLRISGLDVEATYYDGIFVGSGACLSDGDTRFCWSRKNRHSLVFSVRGVTVAVRAPRIAGVDEFHLYAMAESIRFEEAVP